jgi:hypothetical protein
METLTEFLELRCVSFETLFFRMVRVEVRKLWLARVGAVPWEA